MIASYAFRVRYGLGRQVLWKVRLFEAEHTHLLPVYFFVRKE